MHTDTHRLRTLIGTSVLLRPDQQKALMEALPAMTAQQQRRLEQMLDGETEALGDMLAGAVHGGVKRGDTALLKALDGLFKSNATQLRRSEEGVTEEADKAAAESLFDDA